MKVQLLIFQLAFVEKKTQTKIQMCHGNVPELDKLCKRNRNSQTCTENLIKLIHMAYNILPIILNSTINFGNLMKFL